MGSLKAASHCPETRRKKMFEEGETKRGQMAKLKHKHKSNKGLCSFLINPCLSVIL
jgi:hypothetical protein